MNIAIPHFFSNLRVHFFILKLFEKKNLFVFFVIHFNILKKIFSLFFFCIIVKVHTNDVNSHIFDLGNIMF